MCCPGSEELTEVLAVRQARPSRTPLAQGREDPRETQGGRTGRGSDEAAPTGKQTTLSHVSCNRAHAQPARRICRRRQGCPAGASPWGPCRHWRGPSKRQTLVTFYSRPRAPSGLGLPAPSERLGAAASPLGQARLPGPTRLAPCPFSEAKSEGGMGPPGEQECGAPSG